MIRLVWGENHQGTSIERSSGIKMLSSYPQDARAVYEKPPISALMAHFILRSARHFAYAAADDASGARPGVLPAIDAYSSLSLPRAECYCHH